jgi:hypothetical protein
MKSAFLLNSATESMYVLSQDGATIREDTSGGKVACSSLLSLIFALAHSVAPH